MRTRLRCVYAELDGVLGDPLGGRALEACHRAEVEVVLLMGEERADLARELGARAWVHDGGLVLDGEPRGGGEPIASHMQARGLVPEACLAVGALDAPPGMPVREAGFYEAVITEMMERRT